MSVTGIIAEYNPFHTGHAWQIAEIRRQCGPTPIIVAMSGSFVQRGEPAIFDKWLRAELAVLGGADLVLELPFIFSCRSAEAFAQGGVRLLAATGLTPEVLLDGGDKVAAARAVEAFVGLGRDHLAKARAAGMEASMPNPSAATAAMTRNRSRSDFIGDPFP